MPANFKYHITGDTLFVSGDTSTPGDNGFSDRGKVYEEVSLHLPQMKLVTVENSSLGVTGKMDSLEVGLTRLELIKSRVSFKNHFHVNDAPQYFGEVYIVAKNGSEVELAAKTVHFKVLQCELIQSTIRDNETGVIQNFTVKADDSSLVQLGGKNFRKLNIVPAEVNLTIP
jgi:hypothetical protein